MTIAVLSVLRHHQRLISIECLGVHGAVFHKKLTVFTTLGFKLYFLVLIEVGSQLRLACGLKQN